MYSFSRTTIVRSLPFAVVTGLFLTTAFFLPPVYGEPTDPTLPSTTTPISHEFLSKPVFKENEQTSVLLNPTFDDNSTNIAFYMKCPNVACPDSGTVDNALYVFSAENLGHGTLPFSEYWAPPVPTSFIVIEYKNDNQQFTCSDKTLETCKADPHFVGLTTFALVDNTTIITPAMIAAETSTIVGDNTTLTSDLASSTVVTTTLDNSVPADNTTTSSLSAAGSAFSTFVSGIITSIVDAVLPGDQSGSSSIPTPDTAATSSDISPTSQTPAETPAVTANPTSNETITTQF